MEDQVILNNDRDRRTFTWLRQKAGDDAVAQAIAGLSGARKPYVSNLCKVLGLAPPTALEKTDREVAQTNLAAIRATLKMQSKAKG
jgi:hypothetical protein